MFWNKKNRKKELEQEIYKCEQQLTVYKQLLEEIKNNYLPLCEKCKDVIRSHNLNRHRLHDVFGVEFQDGKLRLMVYDCKEDYWDGEKTLVRGDVLFDETISLDSLKYEYFPDFTNNYLFDLIARLEDPTTFIKHCVDSLQSRIEQYKTELNK